MDAFDRLAAVVGAFSKHMQTVKTTDDIPLIQNEYGHFCQFMQLTSKASK